MEQIAYGLLNPATGNLLRVETDVRADDYYGGAWYRFSESSSDPEWLVDDEQTARSAQWFPTTIGINSSLENPLTGRVPLADCQIVKVIKTVQIQPVESTNARPLRDCLDAREYTDYQNWENNNKQTWATLPSAGDGRNHAATGIGAGGRSVLEGVQHNV